MFGQQAFQTMEDPNSKESSRKDDGRDFGMRAIFFEPDPLARVFTGSWRKCYTTALSQRSLTAHSQAFGQRLRISEMVKKKKSLLEGSG